MSHFATRYLPAHIAHAEVMDADLDNLRAKAEFLMNNAAAKFKAAQDRYAERLIEIDRYYTARELTK